MIAPMKKAWIVVRSADRSEALESLRDLGLVHLEAARPSGTVYEARAAELEAVSRSLNILPQNKDKATEVRLGTERAIGLANEVLGRNSRLGEIYDELGVVEKEIERCAPWGDFDPEELKALEARGLPLRCFESDARREGDIPEGLDYVVLHKDRKRLRFVLVGPSAAGARLPADFLAFDPPRHALSALNARREALKAELGAIDAFFRESSKDAPSLREAASFLAQGIAFEAADASYEDVGGLLALKGYLPAREVDALAALAKREGWAILVDEPGPEDAPPTKVENGKVVGIIKPVFDFLGIVPGYGEYEISGWFLGFFALFTAMIFGDGGYGLLMLAAWTFAALGARRKGQGLTAPLKLFLLIAVLTIGWGAATGTWFSIQADSLPSFLRSIAIEPISSANPAASKNIQIFCFLLGALQLAIARIKNIVRDFPDPKFIAQLGSLALIGGMLFLVLNLVVDSKRFPVPSWAVWLVAGGFLANLVFGAYEGNILKSTIEGLKSIIPTFLGAVGVFADIVSYIRLWALGLAGSSLAAIINQMGGGLVKAALIGVMGVVILVFGHGLNMILSVLSVVVHAIRLNILEFSCNHLGMQWSGVAYEPFRRTFEGDERKGKELQA